MTILPLPVIEWCHKNHSDDSIYYSTIDWLIELSRNVWMAEDIVVDSWPLRAPNSTSGLLPFQKENTKDKNYWTETNLVVTFNRILGLLRSEPEFHSQNQEEQKVKRQKQSDESPFCPTKAQHVIILFSSDLFASNVAWQRSDKRALRDAMTRHLLTLSTISV